MCVLFLQVTSLRKTVQNRSGSQVSRDCNHEIPTCPRLDLEDSSQGKQLEEFGWVNTGETTSHVVLDPTGVDG